MRSKTLLWIAGAVAALLPVACNKNGTDKPAASQMQISVKARRNAAGVTVPFAFTATDAFKLVDVTSGSSDIREPMNKGLPQSFFVFSLGKAAVGDLLVAYSPVDAPVEIEGSSVSFRIPENQDGSDIVFPYIGWTKYSGDSYAGDAISAESHAAVIRASIQKGSYSVVKAVLKANGGEKIAGKVTVDTGSKRYTPSAAEVTVTLPSPLDCRSASQSVPFFVAPVNLAGGITLTFFTDDGKQVESKVSTPVNLSSGAVFDTDPASVGRQLIAAGGTKVYIFDEKMARDAGNYKAGLVWEWDSNKEKAKLSRPDHIDDAKPVMDNKKLLVTSSYAWCALVDIETKGLDFYATGLSGAHSAEILPGDRIAVACSDGGDFVALYDKSRPNALIASYPLVSAHGVVWCEKTKRLYAIGGTTLQVYKPNADWDNNPALILEKTISSSGFVSGMHDMTAVDENTLIIGGNKLAFFDITTEKFSAVTAYNKVAGFKSVNYNPSSGEFYYTYAWENYSEGDYTWSSHWIRYTDNLSNSFSPSLPAQGIIRVEDINMYKVRVFNW